MQCSEFPFFLPHWPSVNRYTHPDPILGIQISFPVLKFGKFWKMGRSSWPSSSEVLNLNFIFFNDYSSILPVKIIWCTNLPISCSYFVNVMLVLICFINVSASYVCLFLYFCVLFNVVCSWTKFGRWWQECVEGRWKMWKWWCPPTEFALWVPTLITRFSAQHFHSFLF